MLLPLLFVLAQAPAAAETSARWSCEPAAVELGEPFALVLELEHAPEASPRALLPAAPPLDESWVVFGPEPVTSTPGPAGRVRTRCAWRVASLEPGERALGEALSAVALGEGVARIQVGEARVSVQGILQEGEDAPRPLRGFPPDFAGTAGTDSSSWLLLAALGGLAATAGVLAWWWRRRRARSAVAPAPTALERLAALANGPVEASRERCYELTRLLREAGDELARKPRGSLTDEEWLAAMHASLEIPRGVVGEIAAVFERTTRVKYAGEAPTDWALQETFARALAALQGLKGTGA